MRSTAGTVNAAPATALTAYGQGSGRGVSLANSPRPPSADATRAPKDPYAEHLAPILRHTTHRPGKR